MRPIPNGCGVLIVRIGMDLVEVARIEKAMERAGFLEKILTDRERSQPLSVNRIAGRWAAKEAVAKAVGTHLTWHDVEIVNDGAGAPEVEFPGVEQLPPGCKLHLSITHERFHAAAVAILERIEDHGR